MVGAAFIVMRRDPERLRKLRAAIRYLLQEDALQRGHQSRLAEHFSVSRQRVHQVVNEEERRRADAAAVRLEYSQTTGLGQNANGSRPAGLK